MNKVKGYVVRGKDMAFDGADVVARETRSTGAFATSFLNDPALFTLATALGAQATMMRGDYSDVRIFAVGEDGTEAPLPTYEEALTTITALREEAAQALAWHEPGGMRPNCPPDLAGCPVSALKAILRMTGGVS